MLKIRKQIYHQEPKGELTASIILKKISKREKFNVSDYFQPRLKPTHKLPKIASSIALKQGSKNFYNPWDLADSMKYIRGFRSRHREVIDKIKLKHFEEKVIDFQISPDLKQRVNSSQNIVRIK